MPSRKAATTGRSRSGTVNPASTRRGTVTSGSSSSSVASARSGTATPGRSASAPASAEARISSAVPRMPDL